MRIVKTHVRHACSTLILAAALAGQAHAETAQASGETGAADPKAAPSAPAAPAAQGPIGDIVVTARRKTEGLLETPVAVTAFSADTIARMGIQSLQDVAAFTPGLTIEQAVGRNDRSNQIGIIRGMTPNKTGNVSVFMDGAPIVGSGFIEGVGDMERVEVMKGPQSATFGRATFAGAINNVTRDPSSELHGSVDFQLKTYGGHDVRVSAEGPLLGEDVRFRVTARDYGTAGSYKNTAEPGKRLGAQTTRSVSATLLMTPSDRLSVKLFGVYWQDDDGSSAGYQILGDQLNCAAGALGDTINYYCGKLPGVDLKNTGVNDVVDAAVRNQVINNASGSIAVMPGVPSDFLDHFGLHREAYHAHAILAYDIPSIDAQLSSITSYDDNRYEVISDLDMQDSADDANPYYSDASYGVLQSFLNTVGFVQYRNTGFSQEVRLSGTGNGPIHWSVGASYVEQNIAASAAGLLSTGAYNFQTPAETTTRTAGAFFSAAWDLTDTLTLSAEGRYQQDRQYLRTLTEGTDTIATAKFDNFIPRILLQYKPAPGLMTYASWSKGVNPGGFNSAVSGYSTATAQALQEKYGFGLEVKPEKITNYELGVKSSFWGGRAQLIADVYYARWTNQVVSNSYTITGVEEITEGTLLSVYTNIGRTDLKGLEMQLALVPVPGLTLSGSYAYNDSEIKEYVCYSCSTSITGSTDVTGNSLPQAPKHSATGSLEYRTFVTGSLEAYGRLDAVYTGRMYIDQTNLAWIGDATRLNLRFGVSKKGDFNIEAFVTNLTDNLTYTGGVKYSDYLNGYTNTFSMGLPERRTFGLRFRKTI